MFYDPNDDFEYEKDPNPAKRTWHQIRYRTNEYQEIDRETGLRVAGERAIGIYSIDAMCIYE